MLLFARGTAETVAAGLRRLVGQILALCFVALLLSPPRRRRPAMSSSSINSHSSALQRGVWAVLFTRLSLGVNILVLITVCVVLLAYSDSEPVVYSWGPPTAGRGILLSVYFAILINSIALMWLHFRCSDRAAVEHMVAALLATQILYKITTPATAGPANPVAISNLAISVLHAVTLALLWRQYTERGAGVR